MSLGSFEEHHHTAGYGEIVWFKWNLNAFVAFPMYLFAFACHLNVIPVANILEQPTRGRIFKVSSLATLVQCAFYLLIGITGYLSFLSKTPQDILKGYPVGSVSIAVSRAFLTCSMLIAVPVNLIPTIRSGVQFLEFFRRARDQPPATLVRPDEAPSCQQRATAASGEMLLPAQATIEQPSQLLRICLTLVSLVLMMAVAIAVPGIAIVSGLLGATIATAIVLVIPAYAIRKKMPRTMSSRLQYVVLWAFAIVSFLSVPIQILQITDVLPKDGSW